MTLDALADVFSGVLNGMPSFEDDGSLDHLIKEGG